MYEKKIRTLKKFAGVTSHTIKYYEKEGFFSSIRDRYSNYRFYNLNRCTYLHECIQYRNLGFSVKELNTLCKIANSHTYAIRIKITYETKETHYFKVFIPM